MRRWLLLLLTLPALPVLPAVAAGAVTLGHRDDFQDGTTQLWTAGSDFNPVPPRNLADAGPLGVGDNALSIRGTGQFGSSGGNLVALNPRPFTGASQWTGDYTAAGVTHLFLQAKNAGATNLTVRVGIGAGSSLSSDGMFASNAGFLLPAGSGWQTLVIPISASDLIFSFSNTVTPINDPATALTQVTQLRLLHSTAVTFRGEAIAGELLVDNIVALPEPSLGLQLAFGLGCLWRVQRHRRRRAV